MKRPTMTATIKFRVTPEDAARLDRLARDAGCRRSDLLRRLVADAGLQQPPSQLPVRKPLGDEELELLLADCIRQGQPAQRHGRRAAAAGGPCTTPVSVPPGRRGAVRDPALGVNREQRADADADAP